MNIETIVLDLDGTLLNDEKEISQKTRDILIDSQKKGIRVILASGRPITGMLKYSKQLEMEKYHGLLVSYNGAKVVDCQTNEVLFNQGLTVEEGKAVLHHMKQFDVKVMIDKDDYMYVNDVYDCDINYKGEKVNIIQYESRGGNFKLCEKTDLEEFLDFRLNKILTAGDPEYLQENYQQMMAPFKDTLNCMFTADFYFEFTAKGIDKAKALDTVFDLLGIGEHKIIAFGDAQNDMTLLQYADVGVAMENAMPELKEIADDITLSNNDDGIAHTLEKFI
ncbi:Cof-type HAD-IIB family hydrolase [Vagococcus elongatus]|uniref:HAD family hydrolase n=1 Tax=Vagococcus elongatus TaxID=180344 RepID=A0A430AR27_9ENTE|nr:Cof-type HAD-IIB family hydrolase [Vagococcus elongatus]RSU10549.1 HAD family hydrolase [Vagococcus elongatus]